MFPQGTAFLGGEAKAVAVSWLSMSSVSAGRTYYSWGHPSDQIHRHLASGRLAWLSPVCSSTGGNLFRLNACEGAHGRSAGGSAIAAAGGSAAAWVRSPLHWMQSMSAQWFPPRPRLRAVKKNQPVVLIVRLLLTMMGMGGGLGLVTCGKFDATLRIVHS
jgi:hypothetical protein